ncbi:MAG TPA: porin [Usitatibacteraceae bacterium]
MNKKAIRAAMIGSCAVLAMGATQAFADTNDELKAEIAAQRARLEALEKKLEATARAAQDAQVQAQQAKAQQAQAQPSASVQGLTFASGSSAITLYGLLDITASTIDHADAAGHRKTGYQTAWFSGNRWGITGKHDLGVGGLKAIFKLESEYILNTGEMDTPGVLFNRDAWLGFESDDLGKLTFGRQNTLARDFSQNYGDTYGSANVTLDEGGWTNNNNFKQLIFYAASATSTRYDNGVVWKKKFGDNWVAGLGYQFGSPAVVGQPWKNTSEAAGLAFNGGMFNISGYYDQANVNGLKHKSASIGGNVQLDVVRLNAGYFHYTADQGALGSTVGARKDNAYTVSAKLAPQGKMDYELGYQVLKAENAGYSGSGNTLTPFTNTLGVTTVGTGDKKTVYTSIFYHFDKQAEVYFAADHMTLTNGYKLAVTNSAKSQTEAGIGMRFKF